MPNSLPKASLAVTRLPTDERSSRASGLSWSATRSSWPLPNPTTSHDDGQVQTDASAGPAPPAPASSTRRRLRQTTSRAWTQRATTPTPAIPAVRQPAHRRAPRPHFGRTQRTRQRTNTGRPHRTPIPDAGQRTSGRSDTRTGHWTAIPWTGKRGHWSLAPDTGHRTLAEDVDRQGDEGAAGIRTSWATTPSDRALGRPTVFLWTAPAALDSPYRLGGEAAFQREIASRRQLLGRSAGVERRLGALLSSEDLRVERRANGDASSVMARRLAGGCAWWLSNQWPGTVRE